MNTEENIAKELYSAYCAAAGGKTFNGDPLPSAKEFFSDALKQRQANAWRAVAKRASQLPKN